MLSRTHVAFLRAINIGGRRLTMGELRAAFAPLGFADVATWQATGNVAFGTDPDAAAGDLEARIATVLGEELGIEVPTIVRTADQVRAIASGIPFSDDQVAATEGRVQVLLVRDEPTPAALEEALSHHTDDDQLHWGERELWWLPREGVSTSGLRVRQVEQALGVTTMRTHRAVAGLASKHLSG